MIHFEFRYHNIISLSFFLFLNNIVPVKNWYLSSFVLKTTVKFINFNTTILLVYHGDSIENERCAFIRGSVLCAAVIWPLLQHSARFFCIISQACRSRLRKRSGCVLLLLLFFVLVFLCTGSKIKMRSKYRHSRAYTF